jgi:hypothetical protein
MFSHGNEPVIVPRDMNVIENVKRHVYFSCDTLHHRKLRGFTMKTAVSDRQTPAEQMITISLQVARKTCFYTALQTGSWYSKFHKQNI